MNHKLVFSASAVALALLSGCTANQVRGTGESYSVEHRVKDFSHLDVRGSGVVVLNRSSGSSIEVIAQDEIHQNLVVEQKGDTLIIRPESQVYFKATDILEYHIPVSLIEHIDISGAVDVYGKQLDLSQLWIDASGSSDIELEAQIDQLTIELSGSSRISLVGQGAEFMLDVSGSARVGAADYCVDKVMVEVSGSSDIEVCANDLLSMSLSGSSSLVYYGQPQVNYSTSGSSTIRQGD